MEKNLFLLHPRGGKVGINNDDNDDDNEYDNDDNNKKVRRTV